MKISIPNFRGLTAAVLLPADRNRRALVQQLERLGVVTNEIWPVEPATPVAADAIFFDADRGYDGLFPWESGKPPAPMIAVIGSEAPGRLEWAIAQSPGAYLLKPIQSWGVFNALVIAFHSFDKLAALDATIADLNQRIRARPLVLRAVMELMRRFDLAEDAAFGALRGAAMRRRISVEALAGVIAESADGEAAIADCAAQLPAQRRLAK